MFKNQILICSSFILLLVGCISNSPFFSSLNPDDFRTAFNTEEGILLDVRTPQEISFGQIKNSSSIDFYDEEFVKKVRKIQKDKVVYVYCKSGGRSIKASDILLSEGQYKVVNLKGGFMAWKRAELPITVSDIPKDNLTQELSLSKFEDLLSSNNLVLVDFHTLWCLPCRKITPIIDDLKKEYINSTHVLKVDIDKNEILADTYFIKTVPTLVLFKDTKEIWRHTGLIDKKELNNLIDSHIVKTKIN